MQPLSLSTTLNTAAVLVIITKYSCCPRHRR